MGSWCDHEVLEVLEIKKLPKNRYYLSKCCCFLEFLVPSTSKISWSQLEPLKLCSEVPPVDPQTPLDTLGTNC